MSATAVKKKPSMESSQAAAGPVTAGKSWAAGTDTCTALGRVRKRSGLQGEGRASASVFKERREAGAGGAARQ